MTQNKALWIFPNIKESVDILPQNLRGMAWEMIINYAFGDENVEKKCKNIKVLLVFRAIKPLLRLRGIAGSQNGKSNNPSGLAKKDIPNIAPNIAPNITPNIGANPYITETITETGTETITETETKKYAYEGKVIKLTQKDFDEWKRAYPDLNLYGECMIRDKWLATQPLDVQKTWYVSTSKHFLKRNEMAKQLAKEDLWEN